MLTILTRGAQRAARALAEIAFDPAPVVTLSSVVRADAHALRADYKGEIVGVGFSVLGGFTGTLLVMCTKASGLQLVKTLIPGHSDIFDAAAYSALAEVGNILASRLLNDIADATQKAVLPTPPITHIDDAEVVFVKLLHELSTPGKTAWWVLRATMGPSIEVDILVAQHASRT